jgi:hypothetical protein
MTDRIKLCAFGAAVAALYTALFVFEAEVIRMCSQGGWWLLFPVGAAFTFSIFHGAFTSLFWDVLGVRAKPKR